MKDVTITLNINEANTVIKALGQLPYAQVHELVAKIHGQATEQLQSVKTEETKG